MDNKQEILDGLAAITTNKMKPVFEQIPAAVKKIRDKKAAENKAAKAKAPLADNHIFKAGE